MFADAVRNVTFCYVLPPWVISSLVTECFTMIGPHSTVWCNKVIYGKLTDPFPPLAEMGVVSETSIVDTILDEFARQHPQPLQLYNTSLVCPDEHDLSIFVLTIT